MRETGRWRCGVSERRLGGQGAVSCASFDTVGFHSSFFGGRLGWLAVFCLAVLVVLLSGGASPSWAQTEGDLRLGGPDTAALKGRVEIYHNGQWGTICDDLWGLEDAEVVCRQLEKGPALRRVRQSGLYEEDPDSFGHGNGPILVEDVNCAGTEATLTDCPHPTTTHKNCHIEESAGVECTAADSAAVENSPTPGMVVSKTAMTVAEGGSDTYTVKLLGKAPTGNVTVTISPRSSPADLQFSTEGSTPVDELSLTFTPENWATAQTVTVHVLEDSDAVVDPKADIQQGASGGGYDRTWPGHDWSEPTWGPLVRVTITENDELRKPGRVAAPRVTAQGPTALAVSWDAPTDDGGAPIPNHNVRYRKSGVLSWPGWTHTGPGRQRTIRGLLAVTTYEVQVQAKNAKGNGPWSPSGMGTTLAGPPAAPAAPTVQATSATSLAVSWQAPNDNGAPISDYDVQYRQSGTGPWSDRGHEGPGGQTTITGLRAATPYEVQVRAENAQGDGRWSSSRTRTTFGNTQATGQPTISGVARVGATLTASTSGIMDDDGLTSATYAYQWLRVEGSTETPIAGATSSTYTLTDDDEGKQVKVRVTFTDDGGTGETLDSAATAPVMAAPVIGIGGGGGTGGGGGSSGGGSGGAEGRSGSSSGGSAVEPTGYLENPGPDSFQSGIGVLSGWVCAAEEIEIEIETEGGEVTRYAAAYGTERLDTAAICGDTANGFGLLFNWNLLGDGEYEVVAFVDGVELDRATVTVTTLGAEFLKDVAGQCEVPDFPSVGEAVTLTWQQTSQNFVITAGAAPVGSSNRAGSADLGYLENPGSNSFQSGIGVLSGWVCAAETVKIEITPESGDIARHVAAYGTERLDTQAACGDTDNGFGLLFNWNLLGDGEHAVVAYVDDEELGRATVRVTTLGEEFLRGAEGECVVEDFPSPGETVTLAWQQNQQNFVMTQVE